MLPAVTPRPFIVGNWCCDLKVNVAQAAGVSAALERVGHGAYEGEEY